MARPVLPSSPAAPVRTEPGSFEERVARLMDFLQTFATYLDGASDYNDRQAAIAFAALLSGRLSGQNIANFAGKPLAVNSAGNALESASITSAAFSTEAQARAGTNNTTSMTPLRTRQAIEHSLGDGALWEKIATKAVNDAPRISFSSELEASIYSSYRFVLRNLIPATNTDVLLMTGSFDGGLTIAKSEQLVSNAHDAYGVSGDVVLYDLHGEFGGIGTAAMLGTGAATSVATSLRYYNRPGPINYVDFLFAASDDLFYRGQLYSDADPGGNITSGEIVLYGTRV